MFHAFKYILLTSLLIIIPSTITSAQVRNYSDSLKLALKECNIDYLKQHLQRIDEPIAPGEYTPLTYAIQNGSNRLVKFLLTEKKANPNLRVNGLTPLMYASKTDGGKAIRLLIESGAQINAVDSIGSHSLMMAAIHQPSSVIRYMFRRGAWLNHRNKEGYTAYDIAILNDNKRASATLRKLFEENLPSYTDGPYIEFLPKNKLKITYLKHDSLRRIFSKKENVVPTDQFNNSDQKQFPIKQTFTRDNPSYENINKLVIVGDIHGQCDTLQKFLLSNHIIDSNLNWTFGDGHMVILGDMMDRGEKVTEALWLLYKLEWQAQAAGGKVHVLLGNHELMVFGGDIRYIADKYQFLSKGTAKPYQKLYSSKTVLGKWLRTKNTVVKINDNLFVHGGLSPKLVKENITIDSINNLVHKYINAKKKEKHPIPSMNLILGGNGPFWFRGLIAKHEITEKEVDLILQFYRAKRIFVGHSKSPAINIRFNQKVWGMDVPFYLYTGNPMEAMLIENGEFFKMNTSGMLETINNLIH